MEESTNQSIPNKNRLLNIKPLMLIVATLILIIAIGSTIFFVIKNKSDSNSSDAENTQTNSNTNKSNSATPSPTAKPTVIPTQIKKNETVSLDKDNNQYRNYKAGFSITFAKSAVGRICDNSVEYDLKIFENTQTNKIYLSQAKAGAAVTEIDIERGRPVDISCDIIDNDLDHVLSITSENPNGAKSYTVQSSVLSFGYSTINNPSELTKFAQKFMFYDKCSIEFNNKLKKENGIYKLNASCKQPDGTMKVDTNYEFLYSEEQKLVVGWSPSLQQVYFEGKPIKIEFMKK